jgi:hypothetical protein
LDPRGDERGNAARLLPGEMLSKVALRRQQGFDCSDVPTNTARGLGSVLIMQLLAIRIYVNGIELV